MQLLRRVKREFDLIDLHDAADKHGWEVEDYPVDNQALVEHVTRYAWFCRYYGRALVLSDTATTEPHITKQWVDEAEWFGMDLVSMPEELRVLLGIDAFAETARWIGLVEGISHAQESSDGGSGGSIARIENLLRINLQATIRVGEEVQAQSALLLDLPAEVAARIRQDWKADDEWRAAREALLRGWDKLTDARQRESPMLRAKELCGDDAWEVLQTESRADLIGAMLTRQEWGAQYAGWVEWALARVFERELKEALRRRGEPEERVVSATLDPLISLAMRDGVPLDDELRQVGMVADQQNLPRLRNKAAHPRTFTMVDLGAVEGILFERRLLPRVTTYARS